MQKAFQVHWKVRLKEVPLGVDKLLWRKARFTMLFQRDAPFFIDFHATGGENNHVMSMSGGVENGGGCSFQRAQRVDLLRCESFLQSGLESLRGVD